MLVSITLLINYSLYLSSRYVCVFPILYLLLIILCCIYLNSAPARLAMLFAVFSYIIVIFICVCVNKLKLLQSKSYLNVCVLCKVCKLTHST